MSDLQLYSVYYLGGYIGYVITDDHRIELDASRRILADKLKCNPLCIKFEKRTMRSLPNAVFVRQVFNEKEIGEERSIVL